MGKTPAVNLDRCPGGQASNTVTMDMVVAAEFDPEQPVIEAIQTGDRGAFEELVRRHSRWVRGVVFGVLGDHEGTEDVCQQVWKSVWEQAGSLRDVRRWRPWLYRLARNAAVDAGRQATRRRNLADHISAQADRSALQHEAGPAEQVIADEQRAAVMSAVQALPALYREPLVLRHLEGWSYRRIAEVMDMPVDTVETRLVRARRQLREALGKRLAKQ